jgi:hypothetical protein
MLASLVDTEPEHGHSSSRTTKRLHVDHKELQAHLKKQGVKLPG